MERVLTHLLFVLFLFSFVFVFFLFYCSGYSSWFSQNCAHGVYERKDVSDGSLDREEAKCCDLLQSLSLPVHCHNERIIRMLSSCTHGYSVFLCHTLPVTVNVWIASIHVVNFVINILDWKSSRVILRKEKNILY